MDTDKGHDDFIAGEDVVAERQSTKRNHTVPISLLKHFTDRDGNLWVFDKEERRWFTATPNNVAVERGLYYDDDEAWLADKIETPAIVPLDKVRRGHQIDSIEREIIAKYISVLVRRVQSSRMYAKKVWTGSILGVIRYFEGAIEYVESLGDKPSPAVLQRLSELKNLSPSQVMEELLIPQWEGVPDSLKFTLRGPSDMSEFLSSLAWRVIFSEQTRYIISDNPVHVFSLSGGANSPEFELSVPIGTNCTLHISRQGEERSLQTVKSENLAKRLSVRTLRAASRFVICSRKEKWVSRYNRRLWTPRFDFGSKDYVSLPYGEYCERCGHVFSEEELDVAPIRYETDGEWIKGVREVPHLCQGTRRGP